MNERTDQLANIAASGIEKDVREFSGNVNPLVYRISVPLKFGRCVLIERNDQEPIFGRQQVHREQDRVPSDSLRIIGLRSPGGQLHALRHIHQKDKVDPRLRLGLSLRENPRRGKHHEDQCARSG